MAVEQGLKTLTFPAAADLSAKQFYAVNGNQTDGVNVATATKNMTGILQDKPAAAGRAASVAIEGQSKAAITASTAVTAGNLLEVDTGGTFKVLAGGTAVARAEQSLSSVAVVQIITVTILQSNAAFS
jgi:hypothetical protein